MKIWTGLSVSLSHKIRSTVIVLVLFLMMPAVKVVAQSQSPPDSTATPSPLVHSRRDTVPKPKSVMLKSVIIPGWGQIVNHQIWKVPLIYAGLVGLSMYGVQLTKDYHDFRAAYYNSLADPSSNFHTDERYGPTPAYLNGQSQQALKYYRNYYHNRRDMVFLGVGLMYGLNVLDAYVFAQLRDFDVSNNLSMSTSLTPIVNRAYQGVALSFKFHLKK